MPYITFPNEDGDDVRIPARYEVCDRCGGEGTHVNPDIDGHGITQDEMLELDEEFWDHYRNGTYDVVCYECNGKRVQLVVDKDKADAVTLAAYDEYIIGEIEYRHMCEMERRMGA